MTGDPLADDAARRIMRVGVSEARNTALEAAAAIGLITCSAHGFDPLGRKVHDAIMALRDAMISSDKDGGGAPNEDSPQVQEVVVP